MPGFPQSVSPQNSGSIVRVMSACTSAPCRLCLGGHLKTGHRRTLQNRPTGQNQNNNIYNLYPAGGHAGKQFSHTRLILISPGRRIRQRWEATGAPTQRPEWRAALSRLSRSFWQKGAKSQGFGDRVPNVATHCGVGVFNGPGFPPRPSQTDDFQATRCRFILKW